MRIRKARQEEAAIIGQLLSRYFQRLNQQLGRDFYQTDQQLMSSVVEKRLAEPEDPFVYLVAEEEGQIKGLINLLIRPQKRYGEVLALISLAPEAASDVWLFQQALDYFRQTGVDEVMIEVGPGEEDWHSIISSVSGKKLSTRFLINLGSRVS